MNSRNVIWTPVVREKLIEFRNERFTPEETLNYISQIIIETEEFLRNPVIGKTYTEEFGRYKGISRIIIRKFKIYYNQMFFSFQHSSYTVNFGGFQSLFCKRQIHSDVNYNKSGSSTPSISQRALLTAILKSSSDMSLA